MIYFVRQAGDINAPIKIGYSKNPEQRVKDLQTALPYELELIGTMQGGLKREAQLHNDFADTRLKGEWFKATPELKMRIAALGGNDKIHLENIQVKQATLSATENPRIIFDAMNKRDVNIYLSMSIVITLTVFAGIVALFYFLGIPLTEDQGKYLIIALPVMSKCLSFASILTVRIVAYRSGKVLNGTIEGVQS